MDIVTFGGDHTIKTLTTRVRRAMESTYGLSMDHINVQVFAVPGRPNRLDRVLAVLFALRESLDPAAPRLSITEDTKLLRQVAAELLSAAYGTISRWLATTDVDVGNLCRQLPTPSSLIRRPGTDMPGGYGDVPCVAGHQPDNVRPSLCVPEALYRLARRIVDNFEWATSTARALQELRSERRVFKEHLLNRYNEFRVVVNRRRPDGLDAARQALWASVRRSTEVFQDRLLAVVRRQNVQQFAATDVPPGLLLDFTA